MDEQTFKDLQKLSYEEAKISSTDSKEGATPEIDPNVTAIEFNKPLNIFISGGVSSIIGDHYEVSISPVDKTVQFQKTVLYRFWR